MLSKFMNLCGYYIRIIHTYSILSMYTYVFYLYLQYIIHICIIYIHIIQYIHMSN